jgi:hypothetical protein
MRHIILHGHIFKNAGSSLDWALRRQFGEGFLDHREDKAMRQKQAQHLAQLIEADPALTALSSHHLCYPRPDLEGVRFHPIYMLRHPIERIDSVYAFERRQKAETRGARAAKEKNFKGYVAWRMQNEVPRTIRDYQTCYVAGFHDEQPTKPVPADWLRRSLNHLGRVDCLGVVDRYDESMVVFEHYLGEFFAGIDLSYIRQNSTRRLRGEKRLDDRVRDVMKRLGSLATEVIANNSLDLALYRYANQRLDRALAEIPDIEDRLQDFRGRCGDLRSGSGAS